MYLQVHADTETPVSLFLRWGCDNNLYSVLLESIIGGEKIARYSFVAKNPSVVIKGKNGNFQISRLNHSEKDTLENSKVLDSTQKNLEIKSYHHESVSSKDPLLLIEKEMFSKKFLSDHKLPSFQGGSIGFLGYDAIRYYEEIPDTKQDIDNHDDTFFCIFDEFLVFDHVESSIRIVQIVNPDETKSASQMYQKMVETLELTYVKIFQNPESYPEIVSVLSPLHFEKETSDAEFIESVKISKKHIYDGDIFQILPSRKVRFELDVPPFQVYRALRAVNPSPYMYYFKAEDYKIIGSSPEILVKKAKDKVILRPIAGTRKRGKNSKEDELLEKDLLADPKEIAEHIMLVDLGRNDLGRICKSGSVKVEDLKVIEKYSHVMHIVSQCIGTLDDSKTMFDAVRASLPAGTVSGAPKIRAMEIIDRIEKFHRGIYSGGLGYFSYSEDLDIAIILRTLIVKGNKAYLQAGAGIVYDSDPDFELNETNIKMGAVLRAIEWARSGMVGSPR